jgi:hypothetical protein
MPDIPEPVRAQWFAVADAVHLGSPAEATELPRPLRALASVRDTVTTMPIQDLGRLHTDPWRLARAVGEGLVLASLPREAVVRLLRVAGPDTLSLLTTRRATPRQWPDSGARPGDGTLAALEGEYALFAAGWAPTPAAAASVALGVRRTAPIADTGRPGSPPATDPVPQLVAVRPPS